MRLINTNCPIIVHDVDCHDVIKPKIMDAIKSMGIHSMIEPNEGQQISNTDWHLGATFNRPYYDLIAPVIKSTFENVSKVFNIPNGQNELKVLNYWFQEYSRGDFHTWHIHYGAGFSNVYYLNLPNGSSLTTFNINGKELEIPVKEGSVISFPAFYVHTSKEQKSDEHKISIVFNI